MVKQGFHIRAHYRQGGAPLYQVVVIGNDREIAIEKGLDFLEGELGFRPVHPLTERVSIVEN